MKERFKMWWCQEASYPDGSVMTGRELSLHIGKCALMLVIMPAVLLLSLKHFWPVFPG
ncbi:hypothetical protein [Pseudomonas sp. PLMAX]|uniref:hypothetical protein n=1 Tax=Pseudomonas sp. PLMAX TaxID=2201998 RepID=UPI0038BB0A8C